MNRPYTASWIAALSLATAMAALADGPAGYRPRESGLVATSEQDEIDAYNAGYALILQADHAQDLVAASRSERERAAARREAHDAYLASLEKFEAAIKLDPSNHEAYTYLGYANRKLGRHEAALRAYEQALRINPESPYAIEYQGEALLGLNRVDAARFNYLRLYALDSRQASKLFLAIRSWHAANKSTPPAGVDMESLSAWLTERSASSERDAVKRAASADW